MKAANVFIGIADDMIAAAVLAESMADAKSQLPGLDVIKMTSKTKLFVTFPHFGTRKKAMISGLTKKSKLAARNCGSMPEARVSIVQGRIEFFAAVYIDNMAVRESFLLYLPTTPSTTMQCMVCK